MFGFYSLKAGLANTSKESVETIGYASSVASFTIFPIQYLLRKFLGKNVGTPAPYDVTGEAVGNANVNVSLSSPGPLGPVLPKNINKDFPFCEVQKQSGNLAEIPGASSIKGPYVSQIIMVAFGVTWGFAKGSIQDKLDEFTEKYMEIKENAVKNIRTKGSRICGGLSNLCHLAGRGMGATFVLIDAFGEGVKGVISGLPEKDSISHIFPFSGSMQDSYTSNIAGQEIIANTTLTTRGAANVTAIVDFSKMRATQNDLDVGIVLIMLGVGVPVVHFAGDFLKQLELKLRVDEKIRLDKKDKLEVVEVIDDMVGETQRLLIVDKGDSPDSFLEGTERSPVVMPVRAPSGKTEYRLLPPLTPEEMDTVAGQPFTPSL